MLRHVIIFHCSVFLRGTGRRKNSLCSADTTRRSQRSLNNVGRRVRVNYVGRRARVNYVGRRARVNYVGRRARVNYVGRRARVNYVGRRARVNSGRHLCSLSSV